MRTAGLTMNDVWADRVLREHGVEAYTYEGLYADVEVLVDSVELKHRGKEENYRPYLHLSGELRSIEAPEGLMYGISEVTYSPGQGEKIDAYYEFDDDQLADLARKGYFSNSFAVPEQLDGISWNLPMTVDLMVLSPTNPEIDGGAPVVFARAHDTGNLVIDLESSGYEVAEYFADFSDRETTVEQTMVDSRGLKARSDAINSLFSEDEMTVAEQERRAAGIERMVETKTEAAPVSDVAQGLREAEETIAAEAERMRAEAEQTEGTPENLYQAHVAVAAGRTSEAEAEDQVEQNLDLDDDTEDEADAFAPVPDDGPSPAERRRRITEQASDLDFDEDEERDLGI